MCGGRSSPVVLDWSDWFDCVCLAVQEALVFQENFCRETARFWAWRSSGFYHLRVCGSSAEARIPQWRSMPMTCSSAAENEQDAGWNSCVISLVVATWYPRPASGLTMGLEVQWRHQQATCCFRDFPCGQAETVQCCPMAAAWCTCPLPAQGLDMAEGLWPVWRVILLQKDLSLYNLRAMAFLLFLNECAHTHTDIDI